MKLIDSTKCGSLGVHFFYVTLILGVSVILLATVKFTEQPKFTDYLSTAATITSLVLGLLAIIYAFVSNDSLSRTTGALVNSVDQSKEAASKLTTVLQTVDGVANESAESSKSLSGLVESLTLEISELSKTARSLQESTQSMASILPSIPEEIGALGKRFDEFSASSGAGQLRNEEKNVVSEGAQAEIATSLMARSSPWGYLVMYACFLSKKTGKPFEFSAQVFGNEKVDYFFGFFVCLSSCGLIGYKSVKPEGGGRRAVVVGRHPEIFSQAKERFLVKSKAVSSDAAVAQWLGMLEKLEKSFE
ncbi:hypothetical protein [Achromobacter sp. DH1f]|uniref:hypothetical protein n=1 Tax=Achromobacter sp. DH1f TaxID=1397275 RepID=UPI0012FE9415|nr:hypothetical protein [Achromobacter sp. DH1f]